GDGRHALRRRRLPHHRPIPPAHAQARRDRPLLASRRIRGPQGNRGIQGFPDGVRHAADALQLPRGRGFPPLARRERGSFQIMALATIDAERRLPYTPADLCTLVTDVRAYPSFIPWMKSLSIMQEKTENGVWNAVAQAVVGWRSI